MQASWSRCVLPLSRSWKDSLLRRAPCRRRVSQSRAGPASCGVVVGVCVAEEYHSFIHSSLQLVHEFLFSVCTSALLEEFHSLAHCVVLCSPTTTDWILCCSLVRIWLCAVTVLTRWNCVPFAGKPSRDGSESIRWNRALPLPPCPPLLLFCC